MKREYDQKVSLPSPEVKSIIPAVQVAARNRKKPINWNILHVLNRHPHRMDGANVKVGVLDTGIDFDHPDLKGNIKGGINIVQPVKPPLDDHGHGTHVAGIIAAENNGTGVVGVAPGVSLYAIKVLDQNGSGTLKTLMKGIEWGIAHGMHILNMSISGGKMIFPNLRHVVNKAARCGILIVAAAGNNGLTSGEGDNVQVPARLPEPVAVAALDRNNKRGYFSSTGPAVDIAAPGVNILSTYLHNRYAVLSGTSMSAPHVTGIAAILKQKNPSAIPRMIREILLQRAKDLPPPGHDWHTGAGLIQLSPKDGV